MKKILLTALFLSLMACSLESSANDVQSFAQVAIPELVVNESSAIVQDQLIELSNSSQSLAINSNHILFTEDAAVVDVITMDHVTLRVIGKPVILGGKWFFTVVDNEKSKSFLAVTDGTSIGTKIFSKGPEISYPYTFTEFKNKLYFSGYDEVRGTELWVIDDPAAGARLFKDIEARGHGSTPANFIVAGEQMFFTAYRTDIGVELWVTNGDSSKAGTHLVKDFAGNSSSSPVIRGIVAQLIVKTLNSTIFLP